MGKYFDELKRSMDYLAKKPNTVFLGQAVAYKGTAMTNTLKDVPKEKLIEMPVSEEMQMGITNGVAVEGSVPISIYPRWNFLLLAANQLVNHLDKLPDYSHREYVPKVIIRTGIGSVRPLNPQLQHTGDFTEAFQKMLTNIEVIRLEEPEDIFPAYHKAYNREDGKSTIVVEYGDYYGEK
jgi:pyruvate/2-oxoglutarate/acetoin dehydrogenase E1 component